MACAVPCLGKEDAGSHGRGGQRGQLYLCGAGSGFKCGGGLSDRSRREAEQLCRGHYGPREGVRGDDYRHPESGSCLCAGRSGLSGGAHRVYTGGFGGEDRDDGGDVPPRTGGLPECSTGESRDARTPRLYDLYIGLHRKAEGRYTESSLAPRVHGLEDP